MDLITTAGTAARQTVVSPDGTPIAYFASGTGRPLVLVHGTTSYHGTWGLLRPFLEPRVTVHAMDRRGRGHSGDAPAYDLARERADVAAVVDAVAAATGGPVDLLGHSFGGQCAFGAALLTPHVRRLVLYEGWPPPDPAAFSPPDDVVARIDEALAAGDRDTALVTLYRDVVGVPEEQIAAFRAGAFWAERLAIAPTIPRELRAFARDRLDPTEAARISVPVLMLVGETSDESLLAGHEQVAAALPDARVVVLPGQGHMAHLLAPELLAAEVLRFLEAP